MIRHVVMWELVDPADAERFAGELRRCEALVPGMRAFTVGVRSEALPATADVCLVADFDDRAALDAYQAHPLHRAVSAGLTPLRRTRHLLDYRIDPAPAGR